MALRLSGEGQRDEGSEWMVCDGGSRHRLHIEWSELEDHNLPYEKQIEYEYRIVTWLFLPPVALGKGTLRSSARGRPWTDDMTVTAGRLLTRYVEVRVPSRQDPPNRRRFSLIPRASVWSSVLLVSLFLALVTLFMATTLSTLHFNFTYSHAVAGVGGLVIVAAMRKTLAAVGPHLRTHEPPLLGLGYVFGRTLVGCVVGGTLVWIVPTRCMTSVVNDTQVKVELRLPNSSQPVSLGPGHRITFFGTTSSVAALLAGSLVDEDRKRFCLVDDSNKGYRCEPYSEQEQKTPEERVPELPWAWWSWLPSKLQPSPLKVWCHQRLWEGLDGETAERLGWDPKKIDVTSKTLSSLDGGKHELELDQQCEPLKASELLRVKVDDSSGNVWTYHVPHERHLDELSRSTRVVVDAAEGPVMLRTSVSSVAAASEQASREDKLDITLEGPGTTAAFPLSHPRQVAKLEISIGTPDASGPVQQSVVTCTRTSVDLPSHFRLQQLAIPQGSTSRLLLLEAEGKGALGWGSQWVNTQPRADHAMAPWICATAVGEGTDGKVVAPTDLGEVKLTLQVDFPRPAERWALRIPAMYVGRVIEIKSRSEDVIGELACRSSVSAEAFEIGPLWLRDSRGSRVHAAVAELQVDGQVSGRAGAQNKDERAAGLASRASWSSSWVRTRNADGLRDEFPPWTCRPIVEGDVGCLGCAQDDDGNQDKARVWLGSGRKLRYAAVDLAASRVTLDSVAPPPCFFDEDLSRRLASCSAVRCKPLEVDRRNTINRDLGLTCSEIIPCPPRGVSCPE